MWEGPQGMLPPWVGRWVVWGGEGGERERGSRHARWQRQRGGRQERRQADGGSSRQADGEMGQQQSEGAEAPHPYLNLEVV